MTTTTEAPDVPNIACADALMAIFGLYRVGAEPPLDDDDNPDAQEEARR